MAAFCLIKPLADKFKAALKDGSLDPVKLADMESPERLAKLKELVGEDNARQVNASLEKRLLTEDPRAAVFAYVRKTDRIPADLKPGIVDALKKLDMDGFEKLPKAERRARFAEAVGEEAAGTLEGVYARKLEYAQTHEGLKNWVRELTGVTEQRRQSLLDRIAKMDDRILNPETRKNFLADLAAEKLGTDVTLEEARQISQLSKDLFEARANYESNPEAFGVQRVKMENFINEIKRQNAEVTAEAFKADPLGTSRQAAENVLGLTKSLKATLDLSAFLRQGGKALFTNPAIWAKNVAKTFGDVWETLKRGTDDDTVMDALRAEIYSRKNAFDGTYDKMKLAIGTGEEAFPSSLPEKVPGLGRLFKASEVAYNGFLTRLRADIADEMLKAVERNNAALAENPSGLNRVLRGKETDLRDAKQLEGIGQLVNSLTGRGDLGRAEGIGKLVNVAFFSPKNVKAQIDFLTAHLFDESSTPFTRRQAAKNLAVVTASIATIGAIAGALYPDAVETDARSSDFGKIKVGDTRFDITGGLGSYATLLARIGSFSKKSSTTGAVTELSGAFGKDSVTDTIAAFFGNKASPAAALGRDLLNRQDSDGKPISFKKEFLDLLAPLPLTNAYELYKDPNAASVLAGVLADMVGLSTNTYGDTSKVGEQFKGDPEIAKAIHDIANATGKNVTFEDWDTSKNATIMDFKSTATQQQLDSAKERYVAHIKEKVEAALASETFKKWTDEDKAYYLNQIDTEAREETLKQMGFRRIPKPAVPKKKLKL